MCYKVSTPNKDQLKGYFQKQEADQSKVFTVLNYESNFCADGFASPLLPVTTADAPRLVQPAMWKLIPHWVKTEAEARKYANTLNATCEDIYEKASYKSYIVKNRCLLWVNGFFEPHHPAAKVTIPYYVRAMDQDPFTLGGVFSNWVNQDTGEVLKTFSVITTAANELMSVIHNEKKRMPLIVAPADRDKWLGPLDKDGVLAMMKPLPEGYLEGYAVSNMVYKKGVNCNVPEVILPV